MPAQPLLQVTGLKTSFKTDDGIVRAVDGLSYSVDAGSTLGIVGESGSGKSVNALSIMRLIPQPPGKIEAGTVLFKGENLLEKSEPAMRKIRGHDIAMIFQDPMTSLNPVLTVGEQIAEATQLHLKLSKKDSWDRAVDMLKLVRIPSPEKRIKDYPHQFSGGMRQRVVIALALAGEPRLIVADEPTTALDVSIQAQIISLLKRLCKEHGAAVMLVTHDMGVIAETCDRVAVMYAGRIVEIGPVADVIHAPGHPYTAGLMGSIPAMDEDRPRLLQIDGSMPRLDAIPPGCAFNPRCPRVFDRCLVERPELMPAVRTAAACWLFA